MLRLSIVDKDKSVLAETKGEKIDFTYNGEYGEGHKIVIKADCEYIAVQFDSTLAESIGDYFVSAKLTKHNFPPG